MADVNSWTAWRASLTARPAEGWLRPALRMLALLLVLQIPMWIGQRLSPAPTMLFNVELMVSVLVLLRHPRLGWSLVFVSYGLEAMRQVAVNFHFVELVDFVNALRFAGLLDYRAYLSPWLLAALVALVVVVQAARRLWRACVGQPLRPSAMLVMSIALIDVLNGSSPLVGGGDHFSIPVNVAGSPLWAVVDSMIRARTQPPGQMEIFPAPSHEALKQWHRTRPDASAMVLLVESMGLPKSSAARQWLQSRLDTPAIRQRWHVESTAEVFSGTTTYGELRVLCGLKGSYARMTAEMGANCLPAEWRSEGRSAMAFHGFSLIMFDRGQWWPLVGLTPQTFRPEDKRHCHASFVGVCDEPLIGRAIEAADTPGRFVYALTLDTHLPLSSVASTPRPPELQAICTRDIIADSACELIWRTGRVLSTLAERATRMQTPSFIAVMGDHAPPFVERGARGAFEASRVPLFLLTPMGPEDRARSGR